MTGHDEREIPTFYIMWSRLSSFSYSFVPNHFVPLFSQREWQEINYDEEFPPLANEQEVKSPKAKRIKKNNYFKEGSTTINPRDDTIKSQHQTTSLPFPNVSHHSYENKGQRINNYAQERFKVSNLSSRPFLNASETWYANQSHHWYEKRGEKINNAQEKFKDSNSSFRPFTKASETWYANQSHHWYEKREQKINNAQEKFKDSNSSSRPFTKASETWYARTREETFKKGSEDSLPFKHASEKWYKNRGKLFGKNRSRNQKMQQTPVEKKSLEESVAELEAKPIEEKLSDVVKKDCASVIEAGKYLIENGPLVSAKDLGRVYKEARKSSGKRPFRPSELVRKLKKHFNITQVAINGIVYILENKYPKIQKLAKSLDDSMELNKKKSVNDHIKNSIGHLFNDALAFSGTKKDRDIIKALFTKATSVQFVADLMKIKNKSSIMACRDEFEGNLNEFDELRNTSQIVRNDMTCEQQRRLTVRIINKRKQNMCLAYETRGRNFKSDVFPQLGLILENIFQAGDAGDGGMECHPRLTTDVQYRSKDNNFFMRQAREILLSVAPPKFSIALSTCYNYTESYKQGTYSAKRHHSGKNINARVSLKQPPRIGAFKNVVNLHWSTKNVNLLLEDSENNAEDHMIDSRDAKRKTNAVYPKTHLIMDTSKFRSTLEKQTDDSTDEIEKRIVTRTGQAVMLVNLSFFEPETTFRGMNEIFHMLTLPELDGLFRNPSSKKLKSIFNFIVDNGHSEDPDSPLTQMCLVRILRMLGLSKISQRSFAEYHSKRNFAERPHAAANEVLSRHGAFSSSLIHKNATTGSNEHRENMEEMAKNVQNCLSQARFGGHFIKAVRGVIENEQIFNDERELKQFLALNEERKSECTWTYTAAQNQPFETLALCWGLPQK
ncbi:Hypothetical predicted protein [Paramuricea clavata]|uniref:Uncharacterized protein n=1 Tax=Paramuricea clavata TaxID=317549 RepID=A0A6S7FT08_PARCT|nr:Hypothetical predicted protein [Paramuricea clavata]